MRDILKPAVSLLLICVLVTFSVALVFNITKDTIEAREWEELNEAMSQVMPGGAPFDDISEKAAKIDIETSGARLAGAYESEMGYVFNMTVTGYGGEMTVIVGVGKDAEISGLRLGTNSETPSLGKRAEEEFFTSRFEGVGVEEDVEDAVDAISGATVTSKAVMKAASAAGMYYKELSGGQ
jgi:electron transport complex protein RnfG